MKISQYIDTYYPTLDGVTVTVDNYAKWLSTLQGNSCNVVCVKNNNSEDNFSYSVLRFPSIPLVPKRGYFLSVPFMDKKLLSKIENEKIDIIHAHSPFIIGHLGLKVARKQHIPIVATFHSKFYDDFYQATKSKFISKLLLKYVINFFNKVDFVWTVNNSTVQTLKEYGYSGDVEVMPNGASMEKPENPKELIQNVMNKFNISVQNEIFLFVGQHIWQKNIRLIFEAVSAYKKYNPDFTLLMVGTGNIVNELHSLAKSLGIEKNVIFTGKVMDRNILTGLYLASDLFLFPSVYDNAPIVVREAAVCELPTIAVKNSGSSENIVDNENGFLCEENSKSICSAILRAMHDKAKLKIIGKNASETIPISWEDVAKRVTVRYEELLKEFNKNS